ncbi:MAG: VF530 family protein [Ferruginibacter sp.]
MALNKNVFPEGVTLEAILTELVSHFGWDYLGKAININCFKSNPSIKSSLTFLRKTPWARKKVEQMYLRTFTKNM